MPLGAYLDIIVLPTRFWNIFVYILRIKEFRRHVLVLLRCRNIRQNQCSQNHYSSIAPDAAAKLSTPKGNHVNHLISLPSPTEMALRPAIVESGFQLVRASGPNSSRNFASTELISNKNAALATNVIDELTHDATTHSTEVQKEFSSFSWIELKPDCNNQKPQDEHEIHRTPTQHIHFYGSARNTSHYNQTIVSNTELRKTYYIKNTKVNYNL